LLELLDVEGIGPSTLRIVHEKLKIETKEELIKALEAGKLEKVKGFAVKKIENLKKALKLEVIKLRMPLKEAEKIGYEILNEIKKISGVQQCVLAGSLRRKKETIGDIDILVTTDDKLRKQVMKKITHLPQVKRVLASGNTKASLILKNKNIQVDIRIVHEHEFGAALFYFTGSREHNIQLRTMAKQKGWKVNEYGVFEEKTGKRLAGRTEEELYSLFGLKFIPPEERIGKDELIKARLH